MTHIVKIAQEKTIISGIWKFNAKVVVEEIGNFAKELLLDEPAAYRSMHVRKCSKSQYGICFVYDCGANSHEKVVYDWFFNRLTDRLKRKFGNDFVGWDVTNEVWTLTQSKWPPIDPGTKVKTTQSKTTRCGWTKEAWASRKWGVEGTVITHHDSHGLCYDVEHPDRTMGCYDPSELEILTT